MIANSLTSTIIQADLIWEDASANRTSFEEKILSSNKSDIFVLPEMFTTGFTNNSKELAESMDGISIAWMIDVAKKADAVITGSLIIQEEGHIYNRMIWAQPDGEIFYYDKKHLFAMAGEHKHYSPGEKKTIVNYKGWKILLQVCYDLRFPVWSRRNEQEDYDLVIYVASWPVPRINAWSTLLKARAIENMCYCIGLNRVGIDGYDVSYNGASCIIDPFGFQMEACELDQEDIKSGVLDFEALQIIRRKLPFQKDADAFVLNSSSFV